MTVISMVMASKYITCLSVQYDTICCGFNWSYDCLGKLSIVLVTCTPVNDDDIIRLLRMSGVKLDADETQ